MYPSRAERLPGMLRPHRGNLLRSFHYALAGLEYVVRSERNARIHLGVAAVVMTLSLWLQLDLIEWVLVVAAIALVFAGEMLNTVVELVVDLIVQEEHDLAKRAKDVAAGAVLVAAVAAAIMGVLILGPHLWLKLAPLFA